MDIDRQFPLKVCLNLGVSDRRRQRVRRQFEACDLEVERQPAINGWWLRRTNGYADKGRRACAMGKRLALRRARFRGAEAVLIFEDDVVLDPRFREHLQGIELPADWGMFFLGCEHLEAPEPVADGLVRVRRAVGNHAFALRSPYYREVAAALRGRADLPDGALPASDHLIADLQRDIPSYASAPALAWQASGYSDLLRRRVEYRREDGSVVEAAAPPGGA